MADALRDKTGRFTAGIPPERRYPVGTIRIRSRKRPPGDKRAFIKVAEPGTWVLLAQYRWEQKHGPIPRGMVIHHKDEDKLNDDDSNLELLTKAEHLNRHRDAYREKAVASFKATCKKRSWSRKKRAA